MKKVPLRDIPEIKQFLKRYGKTGDFVDSKYLGNFLQVDGNRYWMDTDTGNWYSDAPGYEDKSYGPINNLLFDTLGLAPYLRNLYKKYGVDLTDIPTEANRNILQMEGDKRLNTYKNMVKDNPDVFFPGEKVPDDALDDLEVGPEWENEYSEYYTPLTDLLDNEVTPEEAQELFGQYKQAILDSKKKFNKNKLSSNTVNKMLDDTSWSVPANIMDAVNKKY